MVLAIRLQGHSRKGDVEQILLHTFLARAKMGLDRQPLREDVD